jgi:hypothetical protein
MAAIFKVPRGKDPMKLTTIPAKNTFINEPGFMQLTALF